MLPRICLLFGMLLWGASVARAQPSGPEQPTVQVRLHWQGTQTVYLPKSRPRQVPTFAEAVAEPGQLLPTYQFTVAGTVATEELRDAVYEPLPEAAGKLLSGVTIPASPLIRRAVGVENHQARTLVRVVPLRRNTSTGQLEKLVSFGYAYSLQNSPTALRRGTRTYAANSVLSQGQWFKIGVPANGIYKLDKATLRTLGLDVQGLDPRRLQLYGNAFGQLPQLNSAPRPDDLVENAIYVSGNNDASFDDNEYVLFYGRGPHTWQPDAANKGLFHHQTHTYTDTTYYFLTVGSALGRRVAQAPAVTGTPTATLTSFPDHQFHEVDLFNLLKSGRQWLGEPFDASTTAQDVTFSLPNLVANEPLALTSVVAAAASRSTSFRLSLNGQSLGSQVVQGYSGDYFPEVANVDQTTFSSTLSSSANEVKVHLAYETGGDFSAKGYLDYLEITAWRQLRLSGSFLEFRALASGSAGSIHTLTLSDANGATVWDVTNPRQPQERPLTNGSFNAPADSLREYVAFTGSAFPAPRLFGRVAPQNLHALSQGNTVDLVIVTHPYFLAEAERLAAHRREHDGLTVQVVTTSQIYNEFSSGGQDITAIRDFLKMVYDKNQRPTSADRLTLLLFGDASYDYKADPANDPAFLPGYWAQRQVSDKNNQNYVPVYESYESFARIFPRAASEGITFSSDDYFGLLDDNEGQWSENYEANFELLDIGIGRLPVRAPADQPRSTEQARLVVDKLITYDQTASFGKWRNRITFVADDGNDNLHLNGAEVLAKQIVAQEPAYNVRKIYLDMYPQQVLAGGQRSQEAAQAIDQTLEEGTLLMNYTGHGGPKAWTDEQIFTTESIKKLRNTQRLSFLLTATCDFSTYDDPSLVSAGEVSLTDVAAGAIGLLTTTRVVISNNNTALNQAFLDAVFQKKNGRLPRLGEVMATTKNESVAGPYNRNFALLGDPSMRLAYPQLTATVREINRHPVTASSTDTLKAMSRVDLAGDVTDASGTVATTFAGTVQVTVLDKPTSVVTLGNESGDAPQTVQVQETVLYDGQATVRDGKFQLGFVIPRDINYTVGPGKISLYAASPALALDAHGANKQVLIGSVAAHIRADSIPPQVRLFMDSESFVFGGLTGSETMLLAQLSDSSGINTAAGIGHEITAVLDNDPSKVIILNSYYTADVDNFRSGRVRYLLKGLAPGPHVLRFKAWDTFNNSTERELEFIVVRNEKLALNHVLNYPNPFATTTTFHFDQNRNGEELEVQVQIFTVTGKLIRTLSAAIPGSPAHVGVLSWDGRDEFNDQVARGVYLYRLHVRSPRDGSQVSKYEKLVLLR